MPLKTGPRSIRPNMQELMTGPIQSQSRRKAINTLMRKHGITEQEAMFRQARAIAIAQSRKR